jgi:Sec-independent protein secretion pathway component TatC
VVPSKVTLKKGGRRQVSEEERKEIFKRKAQMLFLVGIILVVFILFPFTWETYRSVQEFVKNKPEGYRWP